MMPDFNIMMICVLLLLLVVVSLIGVCYQWIQEKQYVWRYLKMRQYLDDSVMRARPWDAQQAQLEATLAAAKDKVILYLDECKRRYLLLERGYQELDDTSLRLEAQYHLALRFDDCLRRSLQLKRGCLPSPPEPQPCFDKEVDDLSLSSVNDEA